MASLPAVLCVVLLSACAAHAAKLARQFEVGEPEGCVVDGVLYPVGEIPNDHPCPTETCTCLGHGQLSCIYVKWNELNAKSGWNYPFIVCGPAPNCVDYVLEYPLGPMCCPTWTCPNGPNCYGLGSTIPVGQTVDVGGGVHCYCPSATGMTTCTTTVAPPTTTTVL
ncbi:uncharacterized protein LOC144915183 [Branchiostoma floridae x Branchiostoma belcheri]